MDILSPLLNQIEIALIADSGDGFCRRYRTKQVLDLTSKWLLKRFVKDIFHVVDIGHGFFIAVRVHSLDRDLPFAHGETILFLSLDDILDSDDL